MTGRENVIVVAIIVVAVLGLFGLFHIFQQRPVTSRYSVTCLGAAGDTLFASDSVWQATPNIFNDGWLFKDVTRGGFRVTTHSDEQAARLFRKLWANRTLFGWQDKDRRRARWLVREMRRHRKKDPKRVAAGKRAQSKGKRSQSAYVKRWRALGFTVRDQYDLEAAGVEVGVDLEVREAKLSIQTKEKKTPMLVREARSAWDQVETIAFLRGHEPVLRWCQNRGGTEDKLDLVTVRERHYAELVQLAGWYQGAIKCD
jgi:hypothetical protein